VKKDYAIPLCNESRSEWDNALKGLKHSFAHTWDNCYAMHLSTGYKTFLYCFEDDDIRIVCPFAEREYGKHKDIVTPYGFSGLPGNGDSKEFKEYWYDFMKKKNYVCGYISINPVFQNDTYFDPDDAFQTTNLFFFDLTKSLTELFEDLNSNRKKQIKNFRRFESSFIYDRKIITDFLLNNYHDFLKSVNASEANYFSTETLEYICSLDNVYMVGAGSADKTEAVYIFSYTDHIGDCMFNISVPEGRKYTSLLFWSGLKFFRSKKIPLMNLGGGLREDDNLALSKARYGGYKLPFKSLKQIYDADAYNQLCIEKGIDAEDKSGYFPAFRKELKVES